MIAARKAVSTERSAIVTGDESDLVSVLGFSETIWQ